MAVVLTLVQTKQVRINAMNTVLLLLLLLLFIYLCIGIELSFGGSSPYTSTGETNKNKYT